MIIKPFLIISLFFLASCQNWSVPEDLYSYPMPPANNYYYNNSPMGYYPNQQPQMNQPSRNMQYYDYDNSYMAPNNSYMAPNNRYQQPVRRAPQVRNIAPRTNYRYDRNRQNIYRSYQPNYYNRPSDNDSLYYYNYTPRNNSVIDQYDVGR